MNIAPQNDSANEDEAIDDEPAASNTANASKYHANSDITNIQMQLDDIQVIQLGSNSKLNLDDFTLSININNCVVHCHSNK